ncbi:GntR family transcriptional regulator [Polaromonas sp. CG_9.11]|uniref:GntR family transcriptional regulator n=1 Tax=Polaromonas sp. CG_9.11 TaxID=2787730 RepID=UPI0018CBDD5F|nr:GntR family transcriptional regulator [Polaromonas sp. CG_9.11]MBG6077256.1 DNA-binding GntR family transcriptional regulator [Polaromonas sp. CG_9.11]
MPAINTPTYMRLRDQVRVDIVSGIWPLGSHVTLAQLAEHYQVSANPVREALLQLQGEGVIAMRMNRGAVIPLVDARYIDNLYRLRGAIQSMLVRDAARMAIPDQVNRMMELASIYETAAHSNDSAACVEANRNLHRHIDVIADNPLAVDLLQGRSTLVDAYRRSVGYGSGRLALVVEQHRKIVRAIAAGDEEKAAQAMLEHTDSSRLDLLATCRAVRG